MKQYPFVNLADANAPYIDQINEAISRVVSSGRYVGGQEVERFEQMLADHAATAHAIGVSNGLDALRLIFKALIINKRLNRGDEIIVPANTYIASVLAVIDAGLKPVFAEPSPETMNLDTERLEQYLTGRTRGIMTVHLYGRPCYDDNLRRFADRHNLIVVEDNAQAIGAIATVAGKSGQCITGGLGDAAAYSFYPTKNIGALGDAGAVTTSDSQLAATIRALANYGSDRRYHNIYIGYNCRLDPIQAAVLSVKLPHIDDETARRQSIADIYSAEINNQAVRLPAQVTDGRHVWHQYVILAENRDQLKEQLSRAGVMTDIHYAVPPHRQPALAEYASLCLPVTDMIADHALSLPITRSTSMSDAHQIAAIINRL